MSEKEFELYLSLLSRFLRLSPTQREEIADELRDHLDERMEELIRRGVSREEAIRRALDEFGDAAGLASHFTHIARDRKRRLIMRCTFGSIVTLAAVMLIATAFWPEAPVVQVNRRAVAQQEPLVPQAAEIVKVPDPLDNWSFEEDKKNALVEKKLEADVDYHFVDMPMNEVLEYISEKHKVPIIINHYSLADEGISPNDEIFNLEAHGIKLRTALDLFFEPRGLTYRLWDGIIYVETKHEAARHFEVRVYNCRDLLSGGGTAVWTRPATPSTRRGDDDEDDATLDTGLARRLGGRRFASRSVPASTAERALIEVVQTSTSGPWESMGGEGGSIIAFDGLLIARQTQAIHRELKELLERIRAAHKERAAEPIRPVRRPDPEPAAPEPEPPASDTENLF